MPSRLLPLAALALLGIAPAALHAQQPTALDPETKAPYLWRVVVQTRPHPLLTKGFREQLRRDLLAALQPGLGTLGTVEVVDLADVPRDHWDPLWQQFDDKGFATLDGPRDLTGTKTHFLRVEVREQGDRLAGADVDRHRRTLPQMRVGPSTPLVQRERLRPPGDGDEPRVRGGRRS